MNQKIEAGELQSEMMRPVVDGMVKSGEEMFEKEMVILEHRINGHSERLQYYLEKMQEEKDSMDEVYKEFRDQKSRPQIVNRQVEGEQGNDDGD